MKTSRCVPALIAALLLSPASTLFLADCNQNETGGADLPCTDAADATDDGSVDITDPIRVLSSLFLSDLGLPPPGAHLCGPDPTPGRSRLRRLRELLTKGRDRR